MYNKHIQKITTSTFLTLMLLLVSNISYGQSGDSRWTEIKEWLAVEMPELGFHPRNPSQPFSSSFTGDFYFGSTNGKVNVNLPLWILNPPARYLAPRTLSRRNNSSMTFETYPIEIKIMKHSNPKYLDHWIRDKQSYFKREYVNKNRPWHETSLEGGKVNYMRTIVSNHRLDVRDVSYAEYRGKRLVLTSTSPIYTVSGILHKDSERPRALYYQQNANANRVIRAGFECTIEGEHFFVLLNTGFRKNIHSNIPFPSEKQVDELLTTVARNIQEAFGNRLDRELTDEQYVRIQKDRKYLTEWGPKLGFDANFEEGMIGIVIASMGDVYRDPGRGKPKKISKGARVYLGDWIRTGPGGRCRIQMSDRHEGYKSGPSVINMATNTEFWFGKFLLGYEDPPDIIQSSISNLFTSINLVVGGIKIILFGNERGNGTGVNVRTGVTVCGIRGSEVTIFYDPHKKLTQAYVLEGHMDVTKTKTGEARSMTANQQLVVKDGNLGKAKPMNRKAWNKLVAKNGLAIGEDDVSDDALDRSSFDVPQLRATVKTVKFFEGPKGKVPRNEREYSPTFSKSKARVINWELTLEYPKADREISFTIDAIWYRSDGTVYCKQTKKTKIKQGWKRSYHAYGRGWKKAGKWKQGEYRVELMVDGKKITEASFDIIQ